MSKGSGFRNRRGWLSLLMLLLLVSFGLISGCGRLLPPRLPDWSLVPPKFLGPPQFSGSPPVEIPVSNPAQVGAIDPDFLWSQIVDAVDDHFRIDDEQPVRRSNLDWLEGRLTTYPTVSGTSFEPWRSDATRGFERLQSTFQTIRRRATVRVVPEPTGYQLFVEVIKEQEDVDQSQFATAGAAAQRHDGSVVRNQNQLRQMPVTLGWYEVGRDLQLERRLIADIIGRVTNVEPPDRGLLAH